MSEPKIEYNVLIQLSDYLQAAKKEVNLQCYKLEFKAIKAEYVVMNQRTFDNLTRALQGEARCYQDDLMVCGVFCGLKVALLQNEHRDTSFELFLKVC
jgi:hypothetical protein